MRSRPLLPVVLAVVAGTAGSLAGPASAATGAPMRTDRVSAASSAASSAAAPVPAADLPASVVTAAALPVARPLATDLGFAGLDGVLPTGAGVWVSHDDVVELVGAAAGVGPGASISQTGAQDLALSPAGDRLFVSVPEIAGSAGTPATPAALRAFDAVTGAPVGGWAAPWPGQPCPRRPAALGDRLYYAYGCAGGPYGVAAVDLATGAAVPDADVGITDTFAAPPRLLSAGSVLVAAEDGAGSSTLRSYLREADGTITAMGTASTPVPADLALAPDGSELALAVGSEVRRLDTAELLTAHAVTPPGASAAVAFGPDVDSFAVGLTGSSTDQLQVRALAGGAVTSRSARRSARGGPVNAPVVPGSLAFSDDGTRLRALVHPDGGNLTLLTATALPVHPTVMGLRLTSPRRYVDPVRLRLTVRGRPGTEVRLVVVDPSGTYTVTPNRRTSSAGVLQLLLDDLPLNGRVVATAAADLTHGAGSTTATFTVPADFEIDLAGQYAVRAGVLRFRSFARIRGLASGLPPRRFTVQLSMQALTRRGWRTAAPAQSATTDADGLLGITVGEFERGVRYRLVVRFAGDRRNTGTIALSRPFLVG